MFEGCVNLERIFVGELWDISNVSKGSDMFSYCFNLVGGDGTLFDPQRTDVSKAYVGSGGYLTQSGQEVKPLKFSSNTIEGVPMNFRVISEEDKTCEVFGFVLGTVYCSPAIPYDTEGNVTIPATANGYKVTRISNNAFDDTSNNHGDTHFSITIPSSVEEIGYRAFGGRKGLVSVTVNEGLIAIGEEAFWGCTSLSSISLPTTLKTIGASAFRSCTGLTSITIPGNVEILSSHVFRDCIGLTEVTLAKGLKTIGSFAFSGCKALSKINLPSSINLIGSGAFNGCNALSEIHSAIKEPFRINSDVFENIAYNNATLYVPTGTMEKYKQTWYWNQFKTMIEEDVIDEPEPGPSEEEYDGWNSLVDKKLETEHYLNGKTIHEWMMFQSNGYLVWGKDGYITQVMDAHVDKDDSSVLLFDFIPGTYKKVIFNTDGTVKMLDESHKEPAVPAGTYTVVDSTDGYDHVGDNTFRTENADGVTMRFRITDEEQKLCQVYGINTTDGKYVSPAIQSQTAGQVNIPGMVNGYTVTEIAPDAFRGCKQVTGFDIPQTVTIISDKAMNECTALATIDIPESVDSLGYYAISACTALTSYTLPKNIPALGICIFSGCTSLTSVTVPAGNGGGAMFAGCTALTDVQFVEGRTTIPEYMFRDCTALESITIPEGVVSLGDNAFRLCAGLKNVTLPESLTEIGSAAFWGCNNLRKVVLGKNIATIDKEAFACVGLKDVYVYATTVPAAHEKAFNTQNNALAEVTLHVSEGTSEAYSSTVPWSFFGKIVVIGSVEDVETVVVDSNTYTLNDDGTATFSGPVGEAGSNVTIPEEIVVDGEPVPVTAIGTGAFFMQPIESVIIPASVSFIGNGAFAGCALLQDIYCRAVTPPTLGIDFSRQALFVTRSGDVPSQFKEVNLNTCVLHVPVGSSYQYRSDAGWGVFENIVETDADAIVPTYISAQRASQEVYNLSGRHLGQTQKGVQIKNGRKVLVR